MISIVHNDVVNAIEIHLDLKGVDLLIGELQRLRQLDPETTNHHHICATNDDRGVSAESPYREKTVYPELILNLLPSQAWEDMKNST